MFLKELPNKQAATAGTVKLTFMDNCYELPGIIESGAIGSVYEVWNSCLSAPGDLKKMLLTAINSQKHAGSRKAPDSFIRAFPEPLKSAVEVVFSQCKDDLVEEILGMGGYLDELVRKNTWHFTFNPPDRERCIEDFSDLLSQGAVFTDDMRLFIDEFHFCQR